MANSTSNVANASSFSGLTPLQKAMNTGSPFSVKLDRHNFLIWKSQVIREARGHGVAAYLFGTKPCPPQTIASVDEAGLAVQIPNPAFDIWTREDQFLLSWLLSSLSPVVLSQVTRCETSRALWTTIDHLFAVPSHARIQQLKIQLQSLKKGNLTMTDYLASLENLADQLAAAGYLVEDDDLVMQALAGVGLLIRRSGNTPILLVRDEPPLITNLENKNFPTQTETNQEQITDEVFREQGEGGNDGDEGGGGQDGGTGWEVVEESESLLAGLIPIWDEQRMCATVCKQEITSYASFAWGIKRAYYMYEDRLRNGNDEGPTSIPPIPGDDYNILNCWPQKSLLFRGIEGSTIDPMSVPWNIMFQKIQDIVLQNENVFRKVGTTINEVAVEDMILTTDIENYTLFFRALEFHLSAVFLVEVHDSFNSMLSWKEYQMTFLDSNHSVLTPPVEFWIVSADGSGIKVDDRNTDNAEDGSPQREPTNWKDFKDGLDIIILSSA